MRRGACGVVTLAVAFGLGCPAGPRSGREDGGAAPRPVRAGNGLNVLLVTIDTLRADHMSLHGYRRETTPHIDALAATGITFEQAYTYWPKTRGSFVAIMTGLLAAQSGYGKSHPLLLDFNPTLAGILQEAGYETIAVVDNPNVAASLGYARGFDRYRETWEEPALVSEVARARAITEDGIRVIREASLEQPFFLWLHYVNPHAPYSPPPPFDTVFLDDEARDDPPLEPVEGFTGGVPRAWEVPGRGLGYYVAQYDGEIAATDAEVGRVLEALESSEVGEQTIVIVTSDHGESLGEHDYYFDHGQNLYDPCMRIPLVMAGPGLAVGHRSDVLATTLDLVPTVLDTVKVSFPPGLAGRSLLGVGKTETSTGGRPRLYGQNDRNLLGSWDHRFKVVATPTEDAADYALYDRRRDPGETRDVGPQMPDALRGQRKDLEEFRERIDAEAVKTRRLLEGRSVVERLSPEACEKLKAMGYIQDACS